MSNKERTLFNTAWSIAKIASEHFGYTPKDFFADSLRITHARTKSEVGKNIIDINNDCEVLYSATGKFKGAVLSIKRNSYIVAETGFNRAQGILDKEVNRLAKMKRDYSNHPKFVKNVNKQIKDLRQKNEKVLSIDEETYNWLSDLFYKGEYSKQNVRGKEQIFTLHKEDTKFSLIKS